MTDYAEFFLNSNSSIVLVECIQISHPDFSQTYNIVRNVIGGVTVVHKDAGGTDIFVDYEYYPLQLREKGSSDDLDFGYSVELGDTGGVLHDELRRIYDADNLTTKPVFKVRQYRSDDYSKVLNGPLILQVNELAFNHEGVQFEPVAPYRNNTATGERYTLSRFPMLRGSL